MKKLLLFLALFAIPPLVHAGTGDVRIVIVNSDGTYAENALPFTANGVLAFGATSGSVATVSLANYATTASLSSYATVASLSSYVTNSSLTSTLASYALASSVPQIRAGSVAVTAALTKAVTFSSAFPTGTTYEVVVITNGLATSGYAASKTVSGFTLTLPIAVTGTLGYIATPDQ